MRILQDAWIGKFEIFGEGVTSLVEPKPQVRWTEVKLKR